MGAGAGGVRVGCALRRAPQTCIPAPAPPAVLRSALATRCSPAVSAYWRNYALCAVGLEWYTCMQRTLHAGAAPVNARGGREPDGIMDGAWAGGAAAGGEVGGWGCSCLCRPHQWRAATHAPEAADHRCSSAPRSPTLCRHRPL